MREKQAAAGYQEISSPEIMDRELWVQSGHVEKFGENMFLTRTPDERVYAIKPMNCPGHVQVFRQGLHSYRELPIRYAEFGKVHRYEPSGALHGLLRVRAFTQDDAHVFVTEDQISEETVRGIELMMSIYRDFGFENVRVKFADRPGAARRRRRRPGRERKRRSKSATRAAGIEYEFNPGEGAFYGPEARVRAEGRDRPRLAMRHLAGRPEPAGPARRALRRRAQPASARRSCCTARSSARSSASSASCSSITPARLPAWLSPRCRRS